MMEPVAEAEARATLSLIAKRQRELMAKGADRAEAWHQASSELGMPQEFISTIMRQFAKMGAAQRAQAPEQEALPEVAVAAESGGLPLAIATHEPVPFVRIYRELFERFGYAPPDKVLCILCHVSENTPASYRSLWRDEGWAFEQTPDKAWRVTAKPRTETERQIDALQAQVSALQAQIAALVAAS